MLYSFRTKFQILSQIMKNKSSSIFSILLIFFIGCNNQSENNEPSGEYIIFSGRDRVSSGFHLYISKIDDGYPKKITWNPYNNKNPIINPYSKKIFFESDRLGVQSIFYLDIEWTGGVIDWIGDWIWESYPEGEEAKPIFPEQSWSRFHNISHSGTYIASMLYPTGQYDIVLFDKTGSYKKIITDQKYDDFYPQFSKDDLTIFYQKKLSNTNMEIFSNDLEGSYEFNLSRNKANDYISRNPSISLNNEKIVFTSDRTGYLDVFIMNLDGSNVRNLTSSKFDDLSPTFSPKHNKVAFISNREGNNDVFVMNLDNNEIINITESEYSETSPKFSPDGKKLAYISDKDNILKIYCYDFDTSQTYDIIKTDFLSGSSFDFFYVD